jgi:hypothetical protein
MTFLSSAIGILLINFTTIFWYMDKKKYSRLEGLSRESYTLPLRALKTQAIAKKPTPTEANPQPATSSYRNAPKAIRSTPTTIIIKVAQASTVFLFIPVV